MPAFESRPGPPTPTLRLPVTRNSEDVAFGYIDDLKEDPVMFKAMSKTGRITRDAVLGGGGGREVLFFPSTKFRVTAAPAAKKAGQKNYLLITMQEI
jgi:hypothetical protein